MSEQVTKLFIVALDHITLRWEDEEIDPKIALALGVVANERAEHDLPEIGKAMTDMLIHGAGFCQVSAAEVNHIPFHDFLQSS